MSPQKHAAVSAVMALGVGVIGGDAIAVTATFLAGTAIDVDHLMDFFLNRQGRFTISRFVSVCNQYRLSRIYLFAHSLELIIPLVLAAFILDAPLWVRGAALGVVVHMAMDLYGNGLYIKAYFLSWRIAVGFNFLRAVAWLPQSGLDYWGSYRAFLRGKPESGSRKGIPSRTLHRAGRRVKGRSA